MAVLVLAVFKVVVLPVTSVSSAPMMKGGPNLPLSFALETSATSGPTVCPDQLYSSARGGQGCGRSKCLLLERCMSCQC